jgi:hypothetical protein
MFLFFYDRGYFFLLKINDFYFINTSCKYNLFISYIKEKFKNKLQ